MKYENDYNQKKMYTYAIFLVLIGCVNLGIEGLTNVNLIEKINDLFNFDKLPSKIIFMIIGLCALILIFNRDVYLPFLGDSVYPCSALTEKEPEYSNTSVSVMVPPNSKVIYWAAESPNKSNSKLKSFEDAYDEYDNSGVTRANESGVAILRFRAPQGYSIPSGKELKPHVHYRYCKYPGMLSRIETVYVAQ